MYSSLALQNEQYHNTEKDKLAQALQQSAKYSDQEFEYNVNQPWQFNMNWAQNKYGAAQKDAQTNRQNTYALASNILGGLGGGMTGGNSSSSSE
jgi:hypothetical protein